MMVCVQPISGCEQYLAEQDIVMDRKDIVSAYMIFGGAPYYWSLLQKGLSLSQNIDRLFFAPNAELAREYSRLYRSVFEDPQPYMAVVTALATKKIGMTREELREKCAAFQRETQTRNTCPITFVTTYGGEAQFLFRPRAVRGQA